MTKKYSVLVVDDDQEVGALNTSYVKSLEGFEVVGAAESYEQAVELIKELKPDLVLLDFYLTDRNGLELLTWIRNVYGKPVEVIAVTADRDLNSVRLARQLGVYHYLVKPFSRVQLQERLIDFVSRWERVDESSNSVDQSTIDSLMGTGPMLVAERKSPLPKGLASHTLELVLEHLMLSRRELSAFEVGEILGISRVSARRYLDYLVNTGLAKLNPQFGSAGRPVHKYQYLDR